MRKRFRRQVACPVERIEAIGLHPVIATQQMLEDTLLDQWGEDLEGEDLERAEKAVQRHFKDLHLIEIQLHPANVEMSDEDWINIREPTLLPIADSQVPYDEQPVPEHPGRWAFFLHALTGRKLTSTAGTIALPAPTPPPPHLQFMRYLAP